ncbi:MAG: oligogalacturonate lyase family protein [Oscillospiraceae bacterium]|jgi:oligogalacturonide lyase|nr:oligogalacturonate lyase family protein [Oscillospiraceae bacterium]
MIGDIGALQRQYPSEKTLISDGQSDYKLWRLTGEDTLNYHFYFTENSFIDGDEEIYFLSSRDTHPAVNIFHMDLRSGEIDRLTGVTPPHTLKSATKTRDGRFLLYVIDRELFLHDTKTGNRKIIYTIPEGFSGGRVSMNSDRTLVGILMNERPPVPIAENQPNYGTFMARFYRIKTCRIDVIDLATLNSRTVRIESCHGGHFQFSPTNPEIAMYCHEGPWHLVSQRIWLLNVNTGGIIPCYRQDAQDCVGHEFWTRGGRIFFDNRGAGHDGTITSSRAQAIVTAAHGGEKKPLVGFADEAGNILRLIDMPFYCNHYHATTDEKLLVGDELDDIVLLDISGDTPKRMVLARHGTSWSYSYTHCHPTFGWTDRKVIFASDRTGLTQAYMAEL